MEPAPQTPRYQHKEIQRSARKKKQKKQILIISNHKEKKNGAIIISPVHIQKG